MKWISLQRVGLALVVLGAIASGPGAVGGGEGTRYSFGTPPVNSMGVKSMRDLLGKPVLIDFWGTR